MARSSCNNNGFTLSEVLITLAILSTGIVFIFRAFVTTLSATTYAKNITLACLLAENKTWEIAQDYKNNRPFEPSGMETLQNKEYEWSYTIPAEIDASAPKQLLFSVSWADKPKANKHSITFATYLAPLE